MEKFGIWCIRVVFIIISIIAILLLPLDFFHICNLGVRNLVFVYACYCIFVLPFYSIVEICHAEQKRTEKTEKIEALKKLPAEIKEVDENAAAIYKSYASAIVEV